MEATVEVVGRRPQHCVFREAIATFAHAIRYRHDVSVAWDISQWVEIDPAIQFGAPVLRGTRVTVETVLRNLEVGSAEEVADWYGLSVNQVEGVVRYQTAA